jgi:hypothetical protein
MMAMAIATVWGEVLYLFEHVLLFIHCTMPLDIRQLARVARHEKKGRPISGVDLDLL